MGNVKKNQMVGNLKKTLPDGKNLLKEYTFHTSFHQSWWEMTLIITQPRKPPRTPFHPADFLLYNGFVNVYIFGDQFLVQASSLCAKRFAMLPRGLLG